MGTMDEQISLEVVAQLHTSLRGAAPGLELKQLTQAGKSLSGLRLRERVDLVRDALLNDLPEDFGATRAIVHDGLGDPLLTGWMIWPVSELITTRALTSGTLADFDKAMDSLARLTGRFTSEFAIREMLIARPERALLQAQSWTQHKNEHVRRLATEGTRAYLPWAKRVPWLLAHPRATRAILDASYQDPAEYVRRSAANHLNDLSRIDPAATIETAAGWAENSDGNTSWVLRHGLRTLVKQGNAEALSILGFSGESLSFLPPQINNVRIPWDGSVEFNCQVTNEGKSEAAVAVDYIVGFQRANGSISSKTFKLTTQKIMPGETIMASKTHSFRPITTRKYYPGAHTLTLQVNGQQSSPVDFTLEAKPLLDE